MPSGRRREGDIAAAVTGMQSYGGKGKEVVRMTGWRKWIAMVAGLTLAIGVTGSPLASAGEEPSPNTGRVALTLGADWASAYYFRGIANVQNGGSNVQPYAEIGFKLLENTGPLTSLVISPGIW